MNVDPTIIVGSVGGLLGAIALARTQWKTANRDDTAQVLGAVADARKEEQHDCERHIVRLEKRLDQCEEKHSVANEMILAIVTRIGDPELSRKASRSITPKPFPAVKE